jgi:hypothetical protein
MRLGAPTLKTVMRTAAAAVLWLLVSASVTSAAPGLARSRNRLVCDVESQAQVLRQLLRHPKSYGGPLATKPSHRRLGLRFDLTDHVCRTKRATTGNDAAAIQNDAPAARVDAEDHARPSLRPLGFLVGPIDSHPRTRAFSPRSPRGPPEAV